jgi:acetolactate synthase-1/2/3 large subunit
MAESDLLLSIGSRLSVQFVGLNFDAFSKDSKVIMVDIDGAELNKPGIKTDLPIKADAKIFIQKLLSRIDHYQFQDYSEWLEKCRDYKVRYPLITAEHKRNPIDLYYFVHRLDELSRQNHIFVSDAGSSYFVAGQALKFKYGQREITSGAFASMGLSIPLAIGCSIADKDAQILAITGDGSLELNIQELKTMSCYGLNIKLFVINNGGYVSIRNTQDSVCQGRYIGSDQSSGIETLDLQKVSATFELPYFKIEKHDQIDDKLMEVMSSNGPAFVEVVCDNNQKIIEPFQLSSMVKV